jgi:hypothetical protein
MHSLRLSRMKQPGSNIPGIILLAAVLLLFGLYADTHAGEQPGEHFSSAVSSR